MERKFDRRSFLRVAGTSLSIGPLYSVFPALTRSIGPTITRALAQLNGEVPAPFSFIQLSDTHIGFNGPPDPLGAKAFESVAAGGLLYQGKTGGEFVCDHGVGMAKDC